MSVALRLAAVLWKAFELSTVEIGTDTGSGNLVASRKLPQTLESAEVVPRLCLSEAVETASGTGGTSGTFPKKESLA